MSVQYFTAEGLKKLQEELYQLRSIERPKISQQIAEARDKGDLSENAEYDAAKDAQGLLELKISKLEEVVASARLVDEVTILLVTILGSPTEMAFRPVTSLVNSSLKDIHKTRLGSGFSVLAISAGIFGLSGVGFPFSTSP